MAQILLFASKTRISAIQRDTTAVRKFSATNFSFAESAKYIAFPLVMCYIFKLVDYVISLQKGAYIYGISGKYSQYCHYRPR